MKKNYYQPEMLIAQIALESMVLAGSAAPTPGDMGIHTGVETDDQW